jgi:hypothetical protein
MSRKNRQSAFLTAVTLLSWNAVAVAVGGLLGGLLVGLEAGIAGTLWVAWDLESARRVDSYNQGWSDGHLASRLELSNE